MGEKRFGEKERRLAFFYRPPSTQRGRIYGDNDCLWRGLLLWGQCKLSPPENKHIRTHTYTHTHTHTHTPPLITVASFPQARAPPPPRPYCILPQYISFFSVTPDPEHTNSSLHIENTLYFWPCFNFPLRTVAIANPKKIHCRGCVISRMGCMVFIFSFSCSLLHASRSCF